MIVLQHRITHSIGRGELCVPVDGILRRRYQRLDPTDRLVDQRLLRESHGVAYSLRGVYGLLHRHGLSCLKPHPHRRKNDPRATDQFLDNPQCLSGK